ncbi:MAG: UDP-N-acetylmuramoyl-tripeptide--D-alanyl-D-alanine ligase [Candidatus Omnitrophota bacterium]
MIEVSVSDIITATGGELLEGEARTVVKGFCADSRKDVKGRFFIALKGASFDGHDYLDGVIAQGASGVIMRKDSARVKNITGRAVTVVLVDDTMECMGRLAGYIRKRVRIPVACVTGTNGKTSVKEILSHLLSAEYNVLKSEKSYNNIIGLSLTLFNLEDHHEAMVLELGTNHPGEISELSGIAKPDIGVITNIGCGHLESFYDREGVYKEKITLIDSLPSGGTAVLNNDDDYLSRAGGIKCKKEYYGMKYGSSFRISDVARKEKGYEFALNGNTLYIPFDGIHNVYNAACAASAALIMGIPYAAVKERLTGAPLPGMRLEPVDLGNIIFINDSYNANPDSFECALNVLREKYPRARKGVVAGDMLELGYRSDDLHRKAGRSVYNHGIDFLVTVGDKARFIAEGAVEEGMKTDFVLHAENHRDAAEKVRFMASAEKTVVLLKASRAAKMEEVLKCFTTCYTH